MQTINDLLPGQSFYFPNNKGKLFIFVEFMLWPNGKRKNSKSVITGRLYPIYFSLKKQIIIIPNFQPTNNEKVL